MFGVQRISNIERRLTISDLKINHHSEKDLQTLNSPVRDDMLAYVYCFVQFFPEKQLTNKTNCIFADRF